MAHSVTAALSGVLVAASAACATAPPPRERPITFEQKMAWILRLEDQRVLRDAAPPAEVPGPTPRGRRPAVPVVIAPPDLGRLLEDAEARVRRRAALAVGRVGLAEGVELLVPCLADEVPEVREMAAFALGLIADRGAMRPLEAALTDRSPLVQGRAADALSRLGDARVAEPIARMAAAHVQAGALAGVAEDEMGHPLAPEVEAIRLGLYALGRLKAYEPLAGIVIDRSGRPVSAWWPVSYALAQAGDRRALPALLALARADGESTRVFAAQGLGTLGDPSAVDVLVQLAQAWLTAPRPAVAAVQALGRIGDRRAAKPFVEMLRVGELDPHVRLEIVRALGPFGASEATDMLFDLVSDRSPAMRAAALGALKALDAGTFLRVLSGLDPDPHWSVRAALAGLVATLDPEVAAARMPAFLGDPDARVASAALSAMVGSRVGGIEAAARERLGAEDVVVRMAAARALATLKAEGAAAALSSAYARWAADDTYLARAAALAALTEVDRAAARPVLEQALGDPEWAVRVRAADLLAATGSGQEAVQAIRPAPGRSPELYEAPRLVAPAVTPHAYLETDKGTIQIELYVLDAPLTVENFIALARKGFFDGLPIHRVVPNFVVQGGDPRGDGEGGPGHTLRDEHNDRPYLRGTVGMALDWRDTGGSQFFITHGPQPRLDGRYTVFGRVIAGMDVVDRLQQWDVVREVRIWEGRLPSP